MQAQWTVVAKEKLAIKKTSAKPWGKDFDIRKEIGIVGEQKMGMNTDGTWRTATVVEFIGTEDFPAQWYDRQRFEVDAGRLEEPLLYEDLYRTISDPSLQKHVTVYKLGPGGVVFDEIKEGSEVKFITIASSSYPVTMRHYAVGCEYDKDLLVYNELFNLSIVERAAGKAFNALKNHVHLYPFILYTTTPGYPASNKTGASAIGATLSEKILHTLEDAVTEATNDTTNPRRGPYALLVGTSMLFKLERALTQVDQLGFTVQSSVVDRIQFIIAYDGWTGTRGNKVTTYPGVAANMGYLINLGYIEQDHQSFEKQPLQRTSGNPDVSRFIWDQEIWDSYFTMYCNPLASTEEITFPTS